MLEDVTVGRGDHRLRSLRCNRSRASIQSYVIMYVIDPSDDEYNAYISNVDEVASPGGRVY